MFCKSCGNTVVDGAKFCPNCGGKIEYGIVPVSSENNNDNSNNGNNNNIKRKYKGKLGRINKSASNKNGFRQNFNAYNWITYFAKDETLNSEAAKIAYKKNLNEHDSKITTIVNIHCGIAAAAAITPIPGATIVASVANIWTMYSRINKKVGINIDESKGKIIAKTIVSGIVANLGVGTCASYVAGQMFKFVPGLGSVAGAVLDVAFSVYVTRASAFLYMKIINLLTSDMSQDNLDSLVKETINENRDELKAMYEEEKRNQKNK